MRAALYLGASLIALIGQAHAESPFNFDTTPGKLPKNVVPSAYRIDLATDLKALTLIGQETIDVNVRAPTATITLNQAGLKIAGVKLEDGNSATIKLDEGQQTATFTFAKPVAAGKHTLSITYSGPIIATPNGIYYDDYKTPDGAQKRMLVTQFEVADARRMFPGWDEPAFKATFQLSVTLAQDLTAVSNMPITGTTPAAAGQKRVNFAVTPRMSTYLLALVAGDMQAVSGTSDDSVRTPMSAYAPSGEQAKAKYALDAEEKILPYYNDYFGVQFPLPKLDMIAIPGNYEAGAMENWGAITYIDDSMLFDPKTSSPHTREEIYLTVAHEMAHQWSGDLVTMGWWDNIWLNEGFATWMEEKATDHFNPSWQVWPRQHQLRESAMAQDQLPSTHPIQQVIHDESEANSAFDGISYQKGSQVIRMIEDWISPDTFRDGMRAYMRAHQYSNTTSADLWAALSGAAHRDVAKVAASFTEQPGIPLVKVTDRTCTGGNGQITLAQEPFSSWNSKVKSWSIPVTIAGPKFPAQHIVLDATPVTVPIGHCDTMVKLNWGENGYYRVQYDDVSLKALQKVFPHLSDADRANVLGDQFALFEAKRGSLNDYLAFLPLIKGDRSVAVWHDTVNHLDHIHRALAGTPQQASFDAYAVDLLRPVLAHLGWEPRVGESFLDSELRPVVIAALGTHGDPKVIAEAKKRFALFVQKPDSLNASLREPVLGIVGHYADQATFDQLKHLATAATSTEDKLNYVHAMASASDLNLMRQTVAFAPSGAIPNGRILNAVFVASRESGHPDELYQMVKNDLAEYTAKLPADGMGPNALIAAAAGSSNPELAKALLAEKTSSASRGAKIWAARVADTINNAADMRERTESAVADWVKKT